MAATDSVEKASGGHSFKRRGLLSRQKSSMSFDMGAKKIDQVYINYTDLYRFRTQITFEYDSFF